jgi:hypothetical protein
MDNDSFMEIDNIGNIFWRNKKGDLHRLDGPACEYWGGNKYWYQNGLCHRLDGPAVEFHTSTHFEFIVLIRDMNF